LPLYAYRCTVCGHKFEKIQSFSAEPERQCPKCGGPVERPLSAPRLQFKGAGWYINDYASSSGGSNSESGGEAKPAETKEPAKTAATPAPKPSPAASTPETPSASASTKSSD